MNADQIAICDRFGFALTRVAMTDKVGISPNVRSGLMPINGLRHRPHGETCGWYIWAGDEMGTGDDFFVPLHVSHLGEWCPQVLPYLGLPPGCRFLLAPEHEDVWFDEGLLSTDD